MGLDSHDNGLRITSKWLADAGYELIYAGVYNSAARILQLTIKESVDAVGISFLGGERTRYASKLLQLPMENVLGNVKLIAGGIIPPADVIAMKGSGVHAVFTP
jgi:methylmalonyl-CoA mutase, C-terminal domain